MQNDLQISFIKTSTTYLTSPIELQKFNFSRYSHYQFPTYYYIFRYSINIIVALSYQHDKKNFYV